MKHVTLTIAILVLCVLGRAQADDPEAQMAALKKFVETHKADALAKGWELRSCGGFGTRQVSAISFTYQSGLSGTNSDAINEEIVRRWPEIESLANQSGVTQAIVVAKGDKSITPVEWQCGLALFFVRNGAGEWLKEYVCHTNIPPISVKELQKAYDSQRAAGSSGHEDAAKPQR